MILSKEAIALIKKNKIREFHRLSYQAAFADYSDDLSDIDRETKFPKTFLCGVSKEIMSVPVAASNGQLYESSAISQWKTAYISGHGEAYGRSQQIKDPNTGVLIEDSFVSVPQYYLALHAYFVGADSTHTQKKKKAKEKTLLFRAIFSKGFIEDQKAIIRRASNAVGHFEGLLNPDTSNAILNYMSKWHTSLEVDATNENQYIYLELLALIDSKISSFESESMKRSALASTSHPYPSVLREIKTNIIAYMKMAESNLEFPRAETDKTEEKKRTKKTASKKEDKKRLMLKLNETSYGAISSPANSEPSPSVASTSSSNIVSLSSTLSTSSVTSRVAASSSVASSSNTPKEETNSSPIFERMPDGERSVFSKNFIADQLKLVKAASEAVGEREGLINSNEINTIVGKMGALRSSHKTAYVNLLKHIYETIEAHKKRASNKMAQKYSDALKEINSNIITFIIIAEPDLEKARLSEIKRLKSNNLESRGEQVKSAFVCLLCVPWCPIEYSITMLNCLGMGCDAHTLYGDCLGNNFGDDDDCDDCLSGHSLRSSRAFDDDNWCYCFAPVGSMLSQSHNIYREQQKINTNSNTVKSLRMRR